MEHHENEENVVKVKNVNRKSPKQVSFRLTENEFWKMVGNAENSNANSVSDYAKKIVLKDCRRDSLVPKMPKEEALAMVKELNRVGANINQMTKWMNSSDRVQLEKEEDFIAKFDEFKKEFTKIWQRLN